MELIVILLIIVGAVLLLGLLMSMALKLVGLVITGVVIGALARLVLPGEQKVSLLQTVLAGIIGSVVGGIIGHRLLDAGFLVYLVLSIAGAVAVIAVLNGTGDHDNSAGT